MRKTTCNLGLYCTEGDPSELREREREVLTSVALTGSRGRGGKTVRPGTASTYNEGTSKISKEQKV